MTATMKTIPATMATHAASRKTLGVLWMYGAGSVDAGTGAVAVEDRTVGVSDVSLMRRMMPGKTVVAAMRYLSPSCELKSPPTWLNRRARALIELERADANRELGVCNHKHRWLRT